MYFLILGGLQPCSYVAALRITLRTVVLESETSQLLSFDMLSCFMCSAVLGGRGLLLCKKDQCLQHTHTHTYDRLNLESIDLWPWHSLCDVPVAEEKEPIYSGQTCIWSWVIAFQEMKIASAGVCVWVCICVFSCVYLGLAGLWRSQGLAYHKDYPCAGKYCRYKGAGFLLGGAAQSVLLQKLRWSL